MSYVVPLIGVALALVATQPPAEQDSPAGQPPHGSGAQEPSAQAWPAGQVTPAQERRQAPSRQNSPAGQVTAAQGSAAHAPLSHFCPEGQPCV